MKNPFASIGRFVRKLATTASLGIALAFAAPVVTPDAKAQDAKSYTLLNGGTNKVTSLASNQPIYLNVSEFNDVGLQASVAGTGTSNLLFYVYRSIDSDTYESSVYTTLIAPSASTTNTAFTNITVNGASTLKIVPANTNSGGFVTNVVLKARFKAPKQKISS